MPERIRLSRAAGWKLPSGTAKVDRTTRFGNPFRCTDPAVAVEAFRRWLDGEPVPLGEDLELAFAPSPDRRRTLLEGLPALRGWHLGCWCPLDQACHADELLERANRQDTPDPLAPAAEAALAAARALLSSAVEAGEVLVAGLRAARDAEAQQAPARPYSARRNATALGELAGAVRRKATP